MIKKVFCSGIKRPGEIVSLILILFLICGSALAATITVQSGESIQEAIDQARSGDVIEVMSGTYQGTLDIKKEVALMGIDSGEGMPVIDAGSILGSVFMTANNSQISGFKIVNPNGDGIDVTSSHNTISNNTIEACGAAIYLMVSDKNKIVNNNATVRCQGVMGLLS
ncbi:MAG: right-handed parallel beta-helix repeat-containing protein, partial [Methanothrix soehngenii]